MDRKRKWVSAIYCNTSILNILCDKPFLKLSHMYHVSWGNSGVVAARLFYKWCLYWVVCTLYSPVPPWGLGRGRVEGGPERVGNCPTMQSCTETCDQGAKKISFTACHSGKLKLAFTSPDVISTSPKNVLTSRID